MAPIWQEHSQNGLNRIKRVSDHIMTCSAAVFVQSAGDFYQKEWPSLIRCVCVYMCVCACVCVHMNASTCFQCVCQCECMCVCLCAYCVCIYLSVCLSVRLGKWAVVWFTPKVDVLAMVLETKYMFLYLSQSISKSVYVFIIIHLPMQRPNQVLISLCIY